MKWLVRECLTTRLQLLHKVHDWVESICDVDEEEYYFCYVYICENALLTISEFRIQRSIYLSILV